MDRSPALDNLPRLRRQQVAWVLYDWANSGFGLIMLGPLFSPYFVGSLLPRLADDSGTGLTLAGVTLTGSGVVALMVATVSIGVAVTAPLLGAVADLRGLTKRFFVAFTGVGAIVAMASVLLAPGRWVPAAAIYVLSGYCFAMAFSFYNAFLPRLAPPQGQGRLSGWGFAVGYVGGAMALLIAHRYLPTPWGLAFAGVWWLVFSLPAFFLLDETDPVADPHGPSGPILLAGFRRVLSTFRHLRRYGMLFLFLVAYLIYNNGIDTIINLSPAYGTDALGLTDTTLVTMFLIVQLVAAVGAAGFGHLADRIGNKPVIVINLLVWVLATTLVAFIRPGEEVSVFGYTFTPAGQFLAIGVMIGAVLGGAQSSSRALMALLAPPEIRNEAFGFFSLSGKAVSVFGPLLFAGLNAAYGARAGLFAVLPFLIVGLTLLLFVREPRRGVHLEDV